MSIDSIDINIDIDIEKRTHPVWREWQKITEKGFITTPIMGQFQYIVTNKKNGNKISIVELPNYFRDGVTFWEIYCLTGELFEDVLRYNTYDEALKAAKEHLLKK